MSKVITVALIGAGNRGESYTDIMAKFPEKYKVVAVAEPIESRRNYIKETHNLSENMCFQDWDSLFACGKIADLVIISTQDRQHFEPTMKAISLKYDILLEKPVSPLPEECHKIALYAKEMQVRVVVCHVLRYTPLFMTIKKIIDDGELGDIVSINHEECVGHIHYSHSFCRGSWGNAQRSACMLLAKSCHDLDLLQWLLGKKCRKIQSFGSLTHFCGDYAPAGAPDYCIEGCPQGETCPYNAVKLYMEDEDLLLRELATREVNPTVEMAEHTLRTTQYGKCVYKCDNNVVDHQTVNMLFEGNTTVTFTMAGLSEAGRYIHIMGTKGTLRAALAGEVPIKVYNFETCAAREIPMSGRDGVAYGHGGGDGGIIQTLYDYLTGIGHSSSISDIGISVDNHLLVFAAEKARETGTVVDFEEYVASLNSL